MPAMRAWKLTAVCLCALACSDDEVARRASGPPHDAEVPGADVGAARSNPLLPRVDNETCALPDAPPLGEMDIEEAYAALDFERPVWFGYAPGEPDRRYVVEQGGRIRAFDARPDVARADVFLERPVSRDGNEEGLLGLAFHPRYAENGRLYVYYSASRPRRSVLSEYRRDPADPRRALPDSERVLLEIPQPFSNHNGGDLRFGPDGFLYVSMGDGGSAGDPQGNGQKLSTLLGKILRLDVDREDALCDTPYGIPEDNPFAEDRCRGDERRPEIWAWGLRNPWRMSFDRETGELWAGDVGQDKLEEIDIIRGGLNYGWREVEGTRCYLSTCEPARYEAPVHTYGRDEGTSITGGFVYRGAALPELRGAYVFGDYGSKRIWALTRDGDTWDRTLLANTGMRIVSFGEEPDGEILAVTFDGSRSLLRLRRRGGAQAIPIPEKLSETGCFVDAPRQIPAPGVIPFSVNSPLWSDGADKRRWFALPPGGKAIYRAAGGWDFPEGALLIKSFALGGKLLETRMLRRSFDGWRGYTWRWNEAQDEAMLLAGAETMTLPDGAVWDLPSPAQCDECHTSASGGALGPTTAQLNRETPYRGGSFSQLAALEGAGYVDLPGPPETLPKAPAPDDPDASLEARARALLDANCAGCHRPDGAANAQIDLRLETPLARTGLCDVPPDQGDLGIADARLIAPGAPDRSVLLQRMFIRGEGQMPPLATRVVDGHGAALVGAWIQAMQGCP